MKNILFIIGLSFLAQMTWAQNIIDDHFSHLKDQENATEIRVDGKLFSMANSFKDNDDADVQELAGFLSTITGFSAIGFEELATSDMEYKAGLNQLKISFEELMVIRSKETNFSLYIDEKDGIVRELVGIGYEDKKFGVFSLSGHMDLKQVGKMASEIQMQGFEKIEKIEDYDLTEISVYPNPVSRDGDFTIETSTAFEGGTATLIDANGSSVESYNIDRPSMDISTKNFSAGLYLIEIQKEDVSVKKKLIIVD
jgi:hypothetical protein